MSVTDQPSKQSQNNSSIVLYIYPYFTGTCIKGWPTIHKKPKFVVILYYRYDPIVATCYISFEATRPNFTIAVGRLPRRCYLFSITGTHLTQHLARVDHMKIIILLKDTTSKPQRIGTGDCQCLTLKDVTR